MKITILNGNPDAGDEAFEAYLEQLIEAGRWTRGRTRVSFSGPWAGTSTPWPRRAAASPSPPASASAATSG